MPKASPCKPELKQRESGKVERRRRTMGRQEIILHESVSAMPSGYDPFRGDISLNVARFRDEQPEFL